MIDPQWLADQLLTHGLVSRSGMQRALAMRDVDLCQALMELRLLEEAALLKLLGNHFRTRFITGKKLRQAKIPKRVLDCLPREFCMTHGVLPVRCDAAVSRISIITQDPGDQVVLARVSEQSGMREVESHVALLQAIRNAIYLFYGGPDGTPIQTERRQTLTSYSSLISVGFDGGEPPPPWQPPADRMSGRTLSGLTSGPGPVTEPLSDSESMDETLRGDPLDTTKVAIASLDDLNLLVEVLVDHAEAGAGWRAGHSHGLAQLAERLASAAQLGPDRRAVLRLAALLHEVGFPKTTHLTAPGLSAFRKQREMAEQCHMSPRRLLGRLPLPSGALETLEKRLALPDGGGVPAHKGAVPMGSRLLAAADAFLDMVSNPDTPGGRCHQQELIAARLKEAVKAGSLDPEATGLLLQVLMGEALPSAVLGTPGSILIVDPDEEAHAELLRRLLQENVQVEAVKSTAEAARLLLERPVDLVISEIALAPVDGLELLGRLRKDERTRELPFVFVSTSAEEAAMDRAYALDAADFILKPYVVEQVLAKLLKLIKHKPTARVESHLESGSLQDIDLTTLLKTLADGKKSGLLTVSSAGEQSTVYFHRGEIVQAYHGEASGEAALFTMLDLEHGDFFFDEHSRPIERQINLDPRKLLAPRPGHER